ncbi:MAG: glycosyltransferase [Butyrivibrio sp.]|nr:glycosyltransferase [Butyrivibrio sp.]
MKKNNHVDLISIVLPVYNGEEYLAEAIESVLNQSYSNLELIIVNDGSTDKSLEIANLYADSDSRVLVIDNRANLKLPKTLNVGFSKAKGQYFSWTSADNIYKEKAIEELHNEIQKSDDTIMVYSDYTCIDSKGDFQKKIVVHEINDMMKGNVIGACFLYTRTIAEEIGEYDENLFLAEDYDYWIRMLGHGEIIHVNNDLYLYRLHSKSLTEEKKEYVNQQTYKALKKNFKSLYIRAKDLHIQNELLMQIIIRKGINADYIDKLFEQVIDERNNNYIDDNYFFIQKELSKKILSDIELLNEGDNNDDSLIKEIMDTVCSSAIWPIMYDFPNDLFESKDRIVIYGAGKVGKSYVGMIRIMNNVQLVKWVDRDSINKPSFCGINPDEPKSLLGLNYDYILVAADLEDVYRKIVEDICFMGINKAVVKWVKPQKIGYSS